MPKVRKSKIFIKTQLCFEREQCMGKLLFLPTAAMVAVDDPSANTAASAKGNHDRKFFFLSQP